MDPEDAVRRFERDGFVHLRGFVPPTVLAELTAALEAVAESEPDDNPLSQGDMRFVSNVYRRSAVVRDFAASPAVVELVSRFGGTDLWLRWDQAVWKNPGAPTFPLHQDNGYTQLDHRHLQLWVALTPSFPENGGLLVCPGAHRSALPHRRVGDHVETSPPGELVPISAEAGDAVLFSSFLPHATTPNTTGTPRLAYVAEYLPLAIEDDSVELPHLAVMVQGVPGPRWGALT